MKTSYFVIIIGIALLSGSILSWSQAYAMWVPLTTQQLLEQSKTIFVGNVTGVAPVDVQDQSQWSKYGTLKQNVGPETMTLDQYTVHIEEFLENPQDYNTIKIRQATVGGVPSGPSTISGFDVGDRLVFFIPKYENQTHFPMQYLPESFKIPQSCNGEDVISQKRIIGSNNFTVTQDGVKLDFDNVTANMPIKFLYDKDMGTLFGESFDVKVGIAKVTDQGIQPEFSQEIHAGSKPCQWVTSSSWEFTPKEQGKYIMTIIAKVGNETGEDMSQTPFYVKSGTSTLSHLSPLEQVQSGIAASDVKCNAGFQLIFKTEDDSPACVTPDTAQKLVERGWAKEVISNLDNINNFTNNTMTLGDVKYDTVPFHPDIKQTIELDGISFTYTGNGTVTNGDCYGTWINQTQGKSFSVKAGDEFNRIAFQCCPPSTLPPQIMENGKPVKIGPLRYAISFFDTNQTAGVAECSSDICAWGKDIYVVKQGWNNPVTYDSPSLLQFYLGTNSSVIHAGKAIGIELSDYNTQSRSIRLPFGNHYSFAASSLYPCDYGPFRVAVFEGYVTKESLNDTEPLHFYGPGDYLCQVPSHGKFWIFQPLADTATLVCHLGSYCNESMSSRHLTFNGYWDDKDHFHLFDAGNYAIIAGDQWGHDAVKYFTVTNSTGP